MSQLRDGPTMEVRVTGALAREMSVRGGSPMERTVEKEFLAIRLWAFYNQCHTPMDGKFCEGDGGGSDKRKKEKSGMHPASDYAYTPDLEKSSTWKLRLTNKPGGKPDPRIVGAAVAALGKGFRGRKVQLPAEARAEVVSKVRAAWLKANPKKSADELPTVLQEEAKPAVHGEGLAAAVSFDDIGATWRDNARTAEAKKRFADLPDDALVTVFHGTTVEGAAGLRKTGRVQTPEGYVSDLPTIAMDSLYVAPTRADAANYGKEVVVFDVRKGDMRPSPEAIRNSTSTPDLATAFFNSFDGAILPAGYTIVFPELQKGVAK